MVDLAAYRRARAARRAARAGHPVVTGGPHAAVLRLIATEYVPMGFHAGLWQVGDGRVGHLLRPLYGEPGFDVTRCGIEAIDGEARRAEPSLSPCRRCFPG